ncbi:MAG: hypothetical protein JWN78_2176 [Bacteroidota bacterium]|nr:hypothetical protein [Bacteroidota bacterium]
MKKQFYFSILLVLVTITACKKSSTNAVTEGTFTALTYNVAGLPEPVSQSHPLVNSPQISSRLNNYDIVNVQEDFGYDSLLRLHEHHPFQSKYFAGTSLGDGLNLFSRFLFLDYMRTAWVDCNGTDCYTPKGFTYSRVKLAEHAYIDLYDVHCNAGSDVLDLAARRKNILQMCAYIDYRSKGHAVIIMGDTNTRYTRTGDNIREILNRDFKDVWIELERNGVVPNQDGISLSDCDPTSTYANCEVVDKIFYRSNDEVKLTPLEFAIPGDQFLDANGEWLSDHRPVYAKFKFNVLK